MVRVDEWKKNLEDYGNYKVRIFKPYTADPVIDH